MSGSSNHNSGILAIWNDCAAGYEDEYEAWYQGEHLPERLGVPGFLRGRRYEAVRASTQYFTCYEAVSPNVLTSPAYLECVDNPSPLTARIMSGIFTNMSRTVCRRAMRHGTVRGACAVTAKIDVQGNEEDLDELLADITGQTGVARSEVWISAEDNTEMPSHEETLRGGDAKIAACLFIETLRETDALDVATEVTRRQDTPFVEIGIYRLLCELTNPEVRP